MSNYQTTTISGQIAPLHELAKCTAAGKPLLLIHEIQGGWRSTESSLTAWLPGVRFSRDRKFDGGSADARAYFFSSPIRPAKATLNLSNQDDH